MKSRMYDNQISCLFFFYPLTSLFSEMDDKKRKQKRKRRRKEEERKKQEKENKTERRQIGKKSGEKRKNE